MGANLLPAKRVYASVSRLTDERILNCQTKVSGKVNMILSLLLLFSFYNFYVDNRAYAQL